VPNARRLRRARQVLRTGSSAPGLMRRLFVAKGVSLTTRGGERFVFGLACG
jgi:hypothetical protein